MILSKILFQRIVATISAITTTTVLYHCDCNPTLFIADQWFRRRPFGWYRNDQPCHPFSNQCIWIIGASSGIGEELAYQIVSPIVYNNILSRKTSASLKDDVVIQQQSHHHHPVHVILSSRSREKLELVASKCYELNSNCIVTVLELDVTNNENLLHTVQYLNHTMTKNKGIDVYQNYSGYIDTVIFNAGCGQLSPAIETSTSKIEMIMKQTAYWPMILIPLLYQYNIINVQNPHFVVTSSIAAIIPVPLSATYTAAKHALLGYFRSLQTEQPNILLHTIMPGPVDTKFHNNAIQHPGNITKLPKDTATIHSPMKMSVQRCVQLMISTMQLPFSTESWIVPSPFMLLALYIQKILPHTFLQSTIYSKIGPKRIQLWREGLDLYDPKSWRR